MRIGLDINRARGYGRAFCEGVASWVDVREDWRLEMVDVSGPRTALAGLDGLIAHVVDDRTQKRLARLGIPVVADFYRAAQRGFAQVMPDHAAIGALACDHFRERGFTRFAYCGYDGVLFSDARRDGFRAAAARERDVEQAEAREARGGGNVAQRAFSSRMLVGTKSVSQPVIVTCQSSSSRMPAALS